MSMSETRNEVVTAAKTLIAERDQFDGQDLLETIDDAIDRLRRAVEAPSKHDAIRELSAAARSVIWQFDSPESKDSQHLHNAINRLRDALKQS